MFLWYIFVNDRVSLSMVVGSNGIVIVVAKQIKFMEILEFTMC